MKSIKGFILEGCTYTVILCFVLYLFLAITGVGSSGVPFLKFILVFAYGFTIPTASILRGALKEKPIPAFLLHYVILIAGFVAVYTLNASPSAAATGNIFIAIFLFTVVYACYYGIKAAVKHFFGSRATNGGKAKREKQRTSDSYTPRFGA